MKLPTIKEEKIKHTSRFTSVYKRIKRERKKAAKARAKAKAKKAKEKSKREKQKEKEIKHATAMRKKQERVKQFMESKGLEYSSALFEAVNRKIGKRLSDTEYKELSQRFNMNRIKNWYSTDIQVDGVIAAMNPSLDIDKSFKVKLSYYDTEKHLNRILKDAHGDRLADSILDYIEKKTGTRVVTEKGLDEEDFEVKKGYDPDRPYDLPKYFRFKRVDVKKDIDTIKDILAAQHGSKEAQEIFKEQSSHKSYQTLIKNIQNLPDTDRYDKIKSFEVEDFERLESIMNSSYMWNILRRAHPYEGEEEAATGQRRRGQRKVHPDGKRIDMWKSLFEGMSELDQNSAEFDEIYKMIKNEKDYQTIKYAVDDALRAQGM